MTQWVILVCGYTSRR